jgi:hypothetical protein
MALPYAIIPYKLVYSIRKIIVEISPFIDAEEDK